SLAAPPRSPADIRLHIVAAARQGEADGGLGGAVLAAQQLVCILEEAPLELLRRREMERETRIRVANPAVDVAVRRRRIPHLVNIDIGLTEVCIDTPVGHEHGLVGTRWRTINHADVI